MNDLEFKRKLIDTFKDEACEHLQAIVNGLLLLEKSSQQENRLETIETIHREMHSLKGASRAVNLLDHEMICQGIEKLFFSWKHSDKLITSEVFDVLHVILKHIQEGLILIDISNLKIEKKLLSSLMSKLNAINEGYSHNRSPNLNNNNQVNIDTISTPSDKLLISKTIRIDCSKLDTVLIKAEEMLFIKLVSYRHLDELRMLNNNIRKIRKRHESIMEEINSIKDDNTVLPLYLEFINETLSEVKLSEEYLNNVILKYDKDHRQLNSHIDNLLDDAKKMMMLPCSVLLDSFPAMIRSLCRDKGNSLDISIVGGEIEIDKRILEELKDPLTHIIRNSIDHGIESIIEREKAHKSKNGQLKIAISQLSTNEVEIMVSDDGKGIDLDKVKSAAINKGILTAKEVEAMDDSSALSLIYHSGVSTSPIITSISGQGLGMSIVREKILKLGGRINIISNKNYGTKITICIPYTLATYKGILIDASDKKFIVPTANLERILRVKSADVKSVEGKNVIHINNQTIPLVEISGILKLPKSNKKSDKYNYLSVLVISSDENRIAFSVDNIFNEQEVLVKKLNKPLIKVKYISGFTILGDGTAVPILNSSDLIKAAIMHSQTVITTNTSVDKSCDENSIESKSILLTDDSITTRSLLKNILEMAGFTVMTAVDGADAWRLLKEYKFDLIVSDVDMPRMNGFELTEKVRNDKLLSELPVVLVTGKESREDKERGIDVGANAYITKSDFDDANLLTIIKRLL